MDFEKNLLEVGADIGKLQSMCAAMIENPNLDPGLRQFLELHSEALAKAYEEARRTVPDASRRLNTELDAVAQKTSRAQQQLEEWRQKSQQARAEASRPGPGTQVEPFDVQRGQTIREQLLARFGHQAQRAEERHIGDVHEMLSDDFAHSASNASNPSLPLAPTAPAPPAPAAPRDDADVRHLESTDYEVPSKDPSPGADSADSKKKPDPMSDELWRDRWGD